MAAAAARSMNAILRQWPHVTREQYAAVDCARKEDRFWVRCLGRVVAALTRRSEWAQAREAGGDAWIPRLATRRARYFGTLDNAPAWLEQLERLGDRPGAAGRRGEVARAIVRFRLSTCNGISQRAWRPAPALTAGELLLMGRRGGRALIHSV